jgi:hypothetical protein
LLLLIEGLKLGLNETTELALDFPPSAKAERISNFEDENQRGALVKRVDVYPLAVVYYARNHLMCFLVFFTFGHTVHRLFVKPKARVAGGMFLYSSAANS